MQTAHLEAYGTLWKNDVHTTLCVELEMVMIRSSTIGGKNI